MSDQLITSEKKGQVFYIGLNRATERNAITYDMLRQLSDAYTHYENDSEARCAILFAHGKHFTLGLELPQFSESLEKEQALPVPKGQIDPLGLTEQQRSKPVVSAVQGFCYTIGIEFMLASDINLCTENAKFAQLEVGRGLLPYCGASFRFVERAGWHNAMRYILTSDTFNAEEAMRIGLVQQVTPRGELMGMAEKMAKTICAQSPVAVRAALKQSRQALEALEQNGGRNLLKQTLEVMQSEDFAEGVASFKEKRRADFG